MESSQNKEMLWPDFAFLAPRIKELMNRPVLPGNLPRKKARELN